MEPGSGLQRHGLSDTGDLREELALAALEGPPARDSEQLQGAWQEPEGYIDSGGGSAASALPSLGLPVSSRLSRAQPEPPDSK